MEDEPQQKYFTRPQQSAVVITVLLSAGFLFRFAISGLYGELPILSRAWRIFLVVFAAPGSFIGAMLYYLGILGIIAADEAMIRFVINISFSWFFEFVILIFIYGFTTHLCPRCFNFQDRDIFLLFYQPSKMRRLVWEQQESGEAVGIGNYSVPTSSIPSLPLQETKSQRSIESPVSVTGGGKTLGKRSEYQKLG